MKKTKLFALFFTLAMLTTPTSAQGISQKDYVLGNTLLTLYHEFGHAVVTELGLPVLGKEEDAVDTFSVITISDKLADANNYTDAQAEELDTYLWVTADAWLAFADQDEPDEGSYASEHSLDIQRFYSHACLVYGSDQEFHQSFIDDLDIDPELVEGCEERFEIATENWDLMLADDPDIQMKMPSTIIHIKIRSGKTKQQQQYANWLKNWSWLTDFKTTMETKVKLGTSITVSFEACDEENAYWDPQDQQIVFCYELMDLYANFHTSAG